MLLRYSSNHCTESKSRSLVGSSSSRFSGLPNSALANITRTFSLFDNSLIVLVCNASPMPKCCNSWAASLSASQPFISANFNSKSAARVPSSSDISGLLYKASRSFMFFHKGSCPIKTVSMTKYSSYLKWSCSSTDSRSPGPNSTLPFVGSNSPLMALSRVDLPAPLAPIMP